MQYTSPNMGSLTPMRTAWTGQGKPIVIIETPWRGMGERGLNFARACMFHSLNNDEAPFASHLLYTQVLDDDLEADRKLAFNAARNFYNVCSYIAVYQNLGISPGMEWGINQAQKWCKPIEYRTLKGF